MKKKNSKQANAQKKLKARVRIPRPPAKLDECSIKYLKARLDPFAPDALGACVPDGQSGTSFKFRTTLRGAQIANSSASGVGVLLVITPDAASNVNSITAYEATQNSTLDQLGDGTHPLIGSWPMIGSPFEHAAFSGGNLEQRLVGFEVRVFNRGAPLYQQGVAYGYYEGSFPADGAGNSKVDVMGGNTSAGAYSPYPLVRRVGMTEMHTCPLKLLYAPESELATKEWYKTSRANSLLGTYPNGANYTNMIIFIPADVQSVTNISIECVAHWEVKGRTCRPFSTPNNNSPFTDSVRSAVSNTTRSIFGALPSGIDMVKYAAKLALTTYSGGNPLAIQMPRAVSGHRGRLLEL